jgi:hypothetical protein
MLAGLSPSPLVSQPLRLPHRLAGIGRRATWERPLSRPLTFKADRLLSTTPCHSAALDPGRVTTSWLSEVSVAVEGEDRDPQAADAAVIGLPTTQPARSLPASSHDAIYGRGNMLLGLGVRGNEAASRLWLRWRSVWNKRYPSRTFPAGACSTQAATAISPATSASRRRIASNS